MQITISLHELREFENRYKLWCEGRRDAKEWSIIQAIGPHMTPEIKNVVLEKIQKAKEKQAQWDASNPEPKLIPEA